MEKNINIEKIDLNNDDNVFSIGKVKILNPELFALSCSQAILKSQHTMSANQNNEERDSFLKFQKQLQGIISEICVEEYLKMIFQKHADVIRYDNVRTDNFKSAKNEFDIKIKTKGKSYSVEVRSSLSYKRHMTYNNLKGFDVIGCYTNDAKKHEAYNDFYIRPILQLKNIQKNIDIKNINIFELLMRNEIDIYITGGCSKKMMMDNSIEKSMGQKNTKYQVIPVLKSFDIKAFTDQMRLLKESLKNNNKKSIKLN